jgi:hypothetical protein
MAHAPHKFDDRALVAALLGERDEQRTGTRPDLEVRSQFDDRTCIGTARDRAFGGKYEYRCAVGGIQHRERAGTHDAEYRQRRKCPGQFVQRDRRRGVAGDDKRLHTAPDEHFGRLAGIPADGRGTLRAVWKTRGIAEIDEVLVGERVL